MKNDFFKSALPIWIKGRSREWNVHARLAYTAKDLRGASLTVTGATFYQVFADGKLIHFGPAKKGEGYVGVDVLPLPEIKDGVISIIVAGYYCRCYNGVLIPSFVQAEITDEGGQVMASTGKFGFDCYEYAARLQRVMRYSLQRQFSECYDISKSDKSAEFEICDIDLNYIPRGVDLLDLDEKHSKYVKFGEFTLGEELAIPLRRFQNSTDVGIASQFTPDLYQSTPYVEYLKMIPDYKCSAKRGRCGTVEIWDLGKIETGFLSLRVNAKEDSRIIASFAEQKHDDGRPNPMHSEATNCIEWRLPKGEHSLISFEPYTVMGVEIMITDGQVEIDGVSIVECAYSARKIIPYSVNDPELALVYQAAVDTFRHNAVDVYTDCPSRERAGWLCDSYYTSKTEFDLTGKTTVENEFLNNYLTSGGSREGLDGMLEMCYPATCVVHIPQWPMWYVLQLNDYFCKRGHIGKKDDFKNQLYALLGYFKKYENEYGLLEKLPGWNFVEWSRLNQRVQDVSWPTNMLYSEVLLIVGELYGDEELTKRANALKSTIRNMAFNGKLFLDRAMRREDGTLANTDELSETTQYYALRFGIADIDMQEFAYLKNMFLNEFGKETLAEKYPDIEPSNAFPGFYIRAELMLERRMYAEIQEYIKRFFLPMAQKTGTLWEHKNNAASCDHGFASYMAVVIKICQENL